MVLLEKVSTLRNGCQQLSSKMAARMPMAYVHFVRILVDVYVLMTPFANYQQMGIGAALLTGLVSILYVGLLELAMAMLDPLDDDAYYNNLRDSSDDTDNDALVCFDVSVLLRESAAASHRWIAAGSKLTNQWK
jgi:predicted membrane chloride channel (bestrophin family)